MDDLILVGVIVACRHCDWSYSHHSRVALLIFGFDSSPCLATTHAPMYELCLPSKCGRDMEIIFDDVTDSLTPMCSDSILCHVQVKCHT